MHQPGSNPGLEVHTGAPRPGTAVVTADAGVAAGGTITLQGRPFPVASVAPGTRTVWLTPEDITAVYGDPPPRLAEVQLDPAAGVPKLDARAALDRALATFPSVVAYDHDEYVSSLNELLNQRLDAATALLHAIGLTRRWLRVTLAAEALVMALTGALTGVAARVAITLWARGSILTSRTGWPWTLANPPNVRLTGAADPDFGPTFHLVTASQAYPAYPDVTLARGGTAYVTALYLLGRTYIGPSALLVCSKIKLGGVDQRIGQDREAEQLPDEVAGGLPVGVPDAAAADVEGAGQHEVGA
ncbi:hypothetical protein [Dactylosporangium sp. CA-233914]|uniref:hypothetical protein n=1 Tax=Dactylosporangium sp. CA-233914 TaxID=3239934 RepID=UPI003D8E9DAC